MSVDLEQIRELAVLSRLALSEGEMEQLSVELNQILDHMRALDEVETEGVEAMTHPHDAARYDLRPDEPQSSLERDTVLEQSPRTVDGFFVVPVVIANER